MALHILIFFFFLPLLDLSFKLDMGAILIVYGLIYRLFFSVQT